MTKTISKIAVIGSGLMGAGIAAHCANAGAEVVLLDIVPQGAEDRSQLAKTAVSRMAGPRMPALADPAFVDRITAGNLEDDLDKVADCDWVVEVVLEDLAIKQELYARLQEVMRPDAVLSSNTSTLPLADLTAEMTPERKNQFLITHFFNPPRYMRLIELVTHDGNSEETVKSISNFVDHGLGKVIVECRDRPGFIANRLGSMWMFAATVEAAKRGITPEEADAVLSRPFGVPSTGIFGLLDLVGVDLMSRTVATLQSTLEPSDEVVPYTHELGIYAQMAEKGYAGRKVGAGFYRRQKTEDGKTTFETIDLETLEYRPTQKVDALDKDFFANFVSADDRLSDYAWAVMSATLSYATALVPEVCDSPKAVDDAMCLGYNWRKGPFELIDMIGADKLVARLKSEGKNIPALLKEAAEQGGFYKGRGRAQSILMPDGSNIPVPRPEGVIKAADFTDAAPIHKTDVTALYDMGDGVALFTILTKNAALDDNVMEGLSAALDIAEQDFKAMVIGSDQPHFSVGADLKKALQRADQEQFDLVQNQLRLGQATLLRMKYASIPVVSAAKGLALGGGCEILLHSDCVVAALESQIGLVEANVGLVPAWGGTTQMLLRHMQKNNSIEAGAVETFNLLARATMAPSAPVAQNVSYLADSDVIILNSDRVLAEAKAKAIELSKGYKAPEKASFPVDPLVISKALAPVLTEFSQSIKDAPYTVEIARELHAILTGTGQGQFDEEHLHKLECEGMMALIRDTRTQDRMRHTMTTGKPLKN